MHFKFEHTVKPMYIEIQNIAAFVIDKWNRLIIIEAGLTTASGGVTIDCLFIL